MVVEGDVEVGAEGLARVRAECPTGLDRFELTRCRCLQKEGTAAG